MVKIGCLARYNNPYEKEVAFAKENGFKLMQIWYDRNGIRSPENEENRLYKIKKLGFPTIIHAVLDINEVEEHIPKLIEIATTLQQKELIIHPVCHSEEINENTIQKLSNILQRVLVTLKKYSIVLFLENNSKLDPIFSASEEIKLIFSQNQELEFLLDIAHIYDYEHLKEMVKIKVPKKLHITDSHFNIIHEHIPLGKGDIDFQYIFKDILPRFEGEIIIELLDDKDIIQAKEIMGEYLKL